LSCQAKPDGGAIHRVFTVKSVNCRAWRVNDSLVWVGSIQWIGRNGLNRFLICSGSSCHERNESCESL